MLFTYARPLLPPYTRRDIFPILVSLFFLLMIPATLLYLDKTTIFHSSAASVTSIEPENGVLGGPVVTGTDSLASGGKYVQFQASTALKPTCTDSLQTQINNAASGATLNVRTDCIYRETITVNKPLILNGQGGAEIRGSDIWGNADWTQQGNYWISSKTLPSFYFTGTCEGNISDAPCHWPEQVFIDGLPLTQVAISSIPLTGQFNLTATRQIQLADNPTNHIVEVTLRSSWIYAYADNVTIEGFTMKHANNAAQSGAIRNYRYGTPDNLQFSNMIIQNNVLSDAHGDVVSFIRGANNKLLNNDIFRGGDLGVHASNSNPLVQGNKIHDNNTEHYSTGWEAGGVKAAGLNGAVFESNESYNNRGPGLWCDGDCINVTYRRNIVHHNKGIGIFFEISDGALITDNIVYENGWVDGSHSWAYESGILISSSSNAEVTNNIVAWNGDGISVISQCRTNSGNCLDLTHRWNNVKGNYIHDNTIIMNPDPVAPYNNFTLAYVRDIKDANGVAYMYMYSPEANNRGANNRYWFPQPDASPKLRFAWTSGYQKIADFNATPGEENGRYLTDTEKSQALQNAAIPTSPEAH